jgi:LSD1 subclass zinc finger protein
MSSAKPTPVEPTVAPLVCGQCGAPVPLGSGAVATCVFCKAEVPVPEPYRVLRATEEDLAAAERLFRKLGKPPSAALRAWAAFVEVSASGLLYGLYLLLSINFAVVFFLGFGLEIVLHALARPLGIDLIDRFGGGTTYMGFAASLVLFGLFPWWLSGYLKSLAEIRRSLQRHTAARPPKKPGFPSTCRGCGAALAVPEGALGVRCVYCQSDNLVALPAEWIKGAGQRQASFHRSIVEANARAGGLGAEARQGFPTAAWVCAAGVLGFGACGRCSVWLDREQTYPTFRESMGPPRRMIPYVSPKDTLPIHRTNAFLNLSPYTLAVRKGEIVQIASDNAGWCWSVSYKNTTTFPLVEREDTVPWGPQVDGTYAARIVAPYTGLLQVSMHLDGEAIEVPQHLRWQIGSTSKPGNAPAPPMKAEPADVPNGPRAALDPWSDDTIKAILKKGSTLPRATAASADHARLVAMRGDRLESWWLEDPLKDSVVRGFFCGAGEVTALVFLDQRTVASGNDEGVIQVWGTDTGMQLYRLAETLPGPVKSLSLSEDGTSLLAMSPGGARQFVVAERSVWTPVGPADAR